MATTAHHTPRTPALAGLSVVICARSPHQWDALVETVATVEERYPAPQDVLVVIDHHDEELLARAARALPDALVIANSASRGLAGARDTGLLHARGERVVFLDDRAACRFLGAPGQRSPRRSALGAAQPQG